MNIIYLKETINYSLGILYKIVEVEKGKTIVCQLHSDMIEFEEYNDFFDTVYFIKNILCAPNECIVIDQKEFDEFYKNTIEKINTFLSY